MVSLKSLEVCNFAALREAALVMARHYEVAVAPAGLTLDEYMMLSKLDRLGGKTVSDLADIMVLEPAVLAYKLKSMLARGLVTSTVGIRDRRSRVIALAPAGREHLAAARPLWAIMHERFETAFGPEESEALRVLLGDITSRDFGHATGV